jgi:hypothetical protein
MHSISIWIYWIPKICHAKNPTLEKMGFHQIRKLFMSSFATIIWWNENKLDYNKPSLTFSLDAGAPNNEWSWISGIWGGLGFRVTQPR